MRCPLLVERCAVVIVLAVVMMAGCVPGKIAFAPEERSKLKEESEIVAFRYSRRVLMPVLKSRIWEYEEAAVKEEPLIALQESFLAAIKAELRLDNIRTLPEPRHHAPDYQYFYKSNKHEKDQQEKDLYQIKRTFQTGLVFNFDRYDIVFEPDSFYINPTIERITDRKLKYRVHILAWASLISVAEQKILWRGDCDITAGGFTVDDLQHPIKPLAQEKLDSATKVCTQELIAQFLGK